MTSTTAITESARVDLDRQRRCGFPEVVFCEGKTPESVAEIFAALVEAGQEAFGTRASPDQAAAVRLRFPRAVHNPVARTIRVEQVSNLPGSTADLKSDAIIEVSDRAGWKPAPHGKVAVVTAGTADRPVAEEAIETLRWMGCAVERIEDVGVAGPQRLLAVVPQLQDCDAVIVIAGMEGALPSVVGGHVSCPVIAVPTSVGYGASFGGIAALLGMLNSCAANVAVVNIDAGFKAGYIAGLIAKQKSAGEGVGSFFQVGDVAARPTNAS